MSITEQYSGIILNQNAKSTGNLSWRSNPFNSNTIYQTFYLPRNYVEGSTSSEQRYPDLSGFQIFVNVDQGYAQSATVDYVLDYYSPGEGWTNLTSGTSIGCHTDLSVWMDIYFPEPVTIDSVIASSQMRFGVTGRQAQNSTLNKLVGVNPNGDYVVENTRISAVLREGVPYPVVVSNTRGFLLLSGGEVTYSVQQGVNALWYVSPTPLIPSSCQAFSSDAKTGIIANESTSLNFRILGLTADNGIDFLGNKFRSCVVRNGGIENSSQNAAVTSTNSTTWRSQPQPSPFAVVSQYFDVRPAPIQSGYTAINSVPNGSFEYDGVGTQPNNWDVDSFSSAIAPSIFTVENGWSAFGENATRVSVSLTSGTVSYVQSSAIPVNAGQLYNVAATVNALHLDTTCRVALYTSWNDVNNVFLQSDLIDWTTTQGVDVLTGNVTVPPSAAFVTIRIGFDSGTGFCDMYFDGVFFGTGSSVYFDGDFPDHIWMAQPGRSASALPNAVVSQDTSVVLNGVAVNPSTPNVIMNVYYSLDDSHQRVNMTETDWEQKLWVRIPEAYVLTAQQQCIFPTPIHAKYVKLEYTNPQAQTYDPGIFGQPVSYKKFPTWVAEYFVAQLESPSFIANSISVENDALNFAYSYYLDDLHELPAKPIPAPPDVVATLTDYFNRNSAHGLVDTTTLTNISFIMQQFRIPTGSLLGGVNSSLIQQYASNIVNANQLAPMSEIPLATTIDYSTVSTLNREPVILEQGMPAMFFFVTCRHSYKELSAPFEYHKAYFVGIDDVSFLRANYSTDTDTTQYIETGGDTQNAEIMDWFVDNDLNWYCY